MQPQKNKKIFFIGRLEYEKWADILLQIIEKTISEHKNLEFHIFGEGSFLEVLQKFPKNFVKVYGKVAREKIFENLKNADFLLMPSRFLETFGLVALESLSLGVLVIGFKKGWLQDFIPENLALNEKNPVENFFQILEDTEKKLIPLVDISRFSLEQWRQNLENLTKNFTKILLVHDYESEIGGAEVYVQNLKKELERLGKKVEFFGFQGELTPGIRKKLFLASIFSQKQGKDLEKMIADFQPDCIWSHTVLRYIWSSGMNAIKKSGVTHYMMHHDLGLFAPQPSKVFSVGQIPNDFRFTSWIFHEKKISKKIIALIKWLIIYKIFTKISKNTLHLVPSDFMKIFVKNATSAEVQTFSHTIFR